MRHIVPLIAVLVVVVACKKETEAPPAAAKESAGSTPTPTPTPAPAPAAPAPTAPPPTPVKLTAEELKPTCAKIFTAELATKTHGATEVKETGAMPRGAICELSKGGEVVGSATIACNPDLDPTGIEREREAMTKDKDLPAPIGRGGYRISNIVFFNDDETPCRIQVTWMTMPADDVLADALRAIAAAITPVTLK